ncbi:MAG: ABC transporter permease subunit [Lachnospiraceae bacterium]|nr:ABC transporter permease subunit [Lachnospiraceae bacterium]
MKAIFKHELSSYLTGVTGYVFGAFVLLFAGIFSMVYNLQYGYTNFEYALSNMSFIFLIIVPVLTMRVLAEERRQKTDQLLYSLPISMVDVVMGKYLAILVVFLIPMAIISLYPLVLSQWGNVFLPASYGAIVAFYLLGASLLAIGMFVSSLTDNQAVAAGLCFVIMLLSYYLSALADFLPTTAKASYTAFAVLILIVAVIFRMMTKNTLSTLILAIVGEGALFVAYSVNSSSFEGLFASVISEVSVFDRFYEFINGVFNLTSVVYYLTVIAIFLFITVQSLEKRRWSE